MLPINIYMTLNKEERQAHLKLDDPCVERGGQSMYCKGLLAHMRDTTIPSGHMAHVAHACHNKLCSNPDHLYWGTSSENSLDRMANGCKTIWENMVEKYGEDEARARQSRSKKLASKAGKGNLGTTKSPEHRRKIAEALRKK